MTVALVIVGMGGAWAWGAAKRERPVAVSVPSKATHTVAVLPFQNAGSDTDLDFLRLALPDEIATLLGRIRSISVRPAASTNRYVQPDLDLQRVGREMRASTVVTGHFFRAADKLHLTLEAIDVDTGRSVWRDQLDAPASNLIATQRQIGLRVNGGLATALGGETSTGTRAPLHEDAYRLFLRTTAITLDPANNAPAIDMLERSVALDPAYPPAWVALARRYYVDSRYGSGRGTLDRYNAAMQRGLTLDPDYIAAASGLVLGPY